MTQQKLQNGLRLVVHKDPSQPLVSVVLVIGAGGGLDPSGKDGLAHLVEHLVFRAKNEAGVTVRDQLNELGANFNAYTSSDETVYFATVPESQGGALMALFKQILHAPLAGVEEQSFQVERNVVENERRLRSENGYASEIFARLDRALYGEGFYGKATGGTGESLQTLTLADAVDYAKRHYRPEGGTFLVAGAVGTAADGIGGELAALEFEARTAPPATAAAPGPQAGGPGPIDRAQAVVGVPELWLAWRLPGAWGDSHAALEVIENLAESSLARTTSIRDDVAGVEAFVDRGPIVSTLYCRAILSSTANVEAVRRALAHELDMGVAQIALDRDWRVIYTRNESTRQMLRFEPLQARALAMASSAHYTGDTDFALRQAAKIDGLGGDVIKSIADQYLNLEQSRAILVEPGASTTGLVSEAQASVAIFGERANLDSAVAANRLDSHLVSQKTLGNGIQLVAVERPGSQFYTALLGFVDGKARKPLAVAEAADWAIVNYIVKPPAGVATSRGRFPDSVRWYARSNVGALELGLETLSDQLSHYDINWKPRAFVEWLKVGAKAETPRQTTDRALWRSLLPASLIVAPSPAEIDAVTVSQIRDWRDEVYRPENAVLVIVGPALASSAADAESALGSWKNRPSRRPVVPTLPYQEAKSGPLQLALTPRPDLSQTHLSFACQLPRHTPAGRAGEDVLAQLVSNRLEWQLREQTGATYNLSSDIERLREGAAAITVTTAVSERHLPAALSLLLGWVEDPAPLLEDRPLASARWTVLSSFAQTGQTTLALANRIFDYQRMGAEPALLAKYPDDVASITREKLQPLILSCRQHAVLAAVGNTAQVGALAAEHLRAWSSR